MTGQWFPLSGPFVSTLIGGVDIRACMEGAAHRRRQGPARPTPQDGRDKRSGCRYRPVALPHSAGEIAPIPPEARVGAVVVHECHRRPYRRQESTSQWKKVRKDSGIPEGVWRSAMRPNAITEARGGGATIDDGDTVAGNANPAIATASDRANLEARQRGAMARVVERRGERLGTALKDFRGLASIRLNRRLSRLSLSCPWGYPAAPRSAVRRRKRRLRALGG